MKSVKILDIPIHAVSETEAIETIGQFIADGRPHQITTVNSEFIVEAQNNDEFRETLQKSDLSLADSTGVTWAARFKGHPLPERIPGADLVNKLSAIGAEKGWKFYLIGAGPGVAEAAADTLKKRYADLQIVGAKEGFPVGSNWLSQTVNDREISNVVDDIKRARPDVLLVAFGAPKQDLFISRFKNELGVPVMIGVGGTFDFIAGRVWRAPGVWRQLGLEWLWRLIQEPSRWPRIFRATIIFPISIIFGQNEK